MWKYIDPALLAKVTEMENLIEQLQADNDRLRKAKADEVVKDVQDSNFVIDWRNMDAFSVERMGDANEAYTIIGYYAINEHGKREVAEWKFYCSHLQHQVLANEFKAYRDDRAEQERKRYEKFI